jgi:PPE family
MAFDFAARPPEINSALMYSGSGAGPLMAASSSFSALSSELSSNAASYESIISQLGSEWTGPSSTAMAASAQTYIGWLTTTSAQLQEAAAAATSSAAAYEAAHAATIPPPVVTANRVQLAALVATNILGQNTPAIMANEAMYAEFWAQDAAAMYGYSAAASAASSALTPLTDPTENTNPAGQGQQAAAVGQAVGSNGTSSTLNNALSGTQNAASSLASPAASAAQDTPATILSAINGLFAVPIVSNTIYNRHDERDPATAGPLRCRDSIRLHHWRRHPPGRRAWLRQHPGGRPSANRRSDGGGYGRSVLGRRAVGASSMVGGDPDHHRRRHHVGGHRLDRGRRRGCCRHGRRAGHHARDGLRRRQVGHGLRRATLRRQAQSHA